MTDDLAETERVVHDAFDWLNGDATKVDANAESVDVCGPALPEGEVHMNGTASAPARVPSARRETP